MVRMALDGTIEIAELRFDLQARTVTVLHAGDAAPVLAKLERLGLGARLSETAEASPDATASASNDALEARTLRVLLAVNAAMFLAGSPSRAGSSPTRSTCWQTRSSTA